MRCQLFLTKPSLSSKKNVSDSKAGKKIGVFSPGSCTSAFFSHDGKWSDASKLPATAAPVCNCQLTKPLATELTQPLATSKAMKPPATAAPEWVPTRCCTNITVSTHGISDSCSDVPPYSRAKILFHRVRAVGSFDVVCLFR